MRVDQLKLRLFSVAAKRVPALEHLQAAHRQTEIFVFQMSLSFAIQLLLARVSDEFIVIAPKPRAASG